MLILKVGAEGQTTSDIEFALEEVLHLVRNGSLSGFNSNDTGRFSFSITGEEEDTTEEEERAGYQKD